MRAVLFANQRCRSPENDLGLGAAGLMPIGDRPALQRSLELLAELGISDVELLLGEEAERLEPLAGNGERYGLRVHSHLLRNVAQGYQLLQRIAARSEESKLLVASAARLPLAVLGTISEPSPEHMLVARSPLDQAEAEPRWSGWAWLESERLSGIQATSSQDLELALGGPESPVMRIEPPALFLSSESPDEVLASQSALLNGARPDLALRFQENDPGIRIGRGSVLHPSTRLIAPVFVGEDCRIEKGCVLGPEVVVQDECRIDARSRVKRSLILGRSYVGPSLEVDGSIIDGSALVKVERDHRVDFDDPQILGNLEAPEIARGLRSVMERAAAGLVLIVFSPILAIVLLQSWLSAVPFERKLRQPLKGPQSRWMHFSLVGLGPKSERPRGRLSRFCYELLPGLLNVLRGEMGLVGVRARSVDEVLAIQPLWRDLITQAQPGLISEGMAAGLSHIEDNEEIQLADVLFAQGKLRRLSVLRRFLSQFLFPSDGQSPSRPEASAAPEPVEATPEPSPVAAVCDDPALFDPEEIRK